MTTTFNPEHETTTQWTEAGSYSPPTGYGAPSYGPGVPMPMPMGQPYPPVGPPAQPASNKRGAQLVVAIIAIVAIVPIGYYVTHRTHTPKPAPVTVVQGTSGQGGATGHGTTTGQGSTSGSGSSTGHGTTTGQGSTSGSGTSTGQGSTTVTEWPAAFADFAALIGSGPDDARAWNGASCVAINNPGGNFLAKISCAEPNGITLDVIEVSNPTSVSALVDAAPSHGETVTTWTQNGGPILGDTITSSTTSGSEIMTTFAAHPSFVVDMSSAGVLSTLHAEWVDAPFPA